MVFKMSYGATPPAQAKAAAVPAQGAPKKKAPSRVRKGGSLKEKAEALFDPASTVPQDEDVPR